MGAADHSEAGEEHDDAMTHWTEERPVDRSHNRDTLSSEAMTEMLRDLQDAMLALDERLVVLESSQDGASEDTRRLAKGVADMGEVLTRRVRALEHGRQALPPILAQPVAPLPLKPARQPPQNRLVWSVGLVVVLALVLAAFWLLGVESHDHAASAAPPRAAATPPPAPPANATPPVSPQTTPKTPSHTTAPPHRWTHPRVSPSDTSPATNSITPATSFGHYGPSPSLTTQTQTPAATPPHPPS